MTNTDADLVAQINKTNKEMQFKNDFHDADSVDAAKELMLQYGTLNSKR